MSKRRKLNNYNARWTPIGSVAALGNVSFTASSHEVAIRKADKIGQEINLPNTPRTIYCGNELVHSKP